MSDALMPAELAQEVVGRRLAWFVARLRDRGAALTDEEVSAWWLTERPSPPPPIRRGMLAHFAAAIPPFTVERWERPRADFAVAHVRDERQRPWRIWVQLEPSPPHRIRTGMPVMGPPPGITLRTSRPEDAAALRALELRCPLVSGDVRVTYDRGADYFAGARLAGDTEAMVAERDGELVAVHSLLTHELRVGDLRFWASYLHHSRILPEAQGGGLFSALNGAELERNAHKSQLNYGYVAVGNEASMRLVPVRPWSVRPERLLIDCRANAGAPYGRPARPDDAPRIVALINAAHGREELFVPYTEERLATRLGREPATYGWAHLLLGERAVVGVWPAGIRIVREAPEGREDTVRALVLDTGFEPGAEAELVELLRAWCASLSSRGCSHMTLFTSPGSPARDVLHALALRTEPYHLNFGLPEPPDLAARGVYVDQLYF